MSTKIEWTDHTWNPVTGCTPISAGCKNCYAAKLVRRLAGRFGYDSADPFKITLHHDKVLTPNKWKSPRKIFISSMGDLFHNGVPDIWIDLVLSITAVASQHTYLILTKRAERMKYYLDAMVESRGAEPILENVWFGVTAENQEMADYRIPLLIDLPVPNKFVSVEPMLTPMDLSLYINNLDWIIVGGETGIKARYMDPSWAIAVMDLCKQYDVPFFFKQMSQKKPAPIELLVKQFPSVMP